VFASFIIFDGASLMLSRVGWSEKRSTTKLGQNIYLQKEYIFSEAPKTHPDVSVMIVYVGHGQGKAKASGSDK
jgi:hypothetical protein